MSVFNWGPPKINSFMLWVCKAELTRTPSMKKGFRINTDEKGTVGVQKSVHNLSSCMQLNTHLWLSGQLAQKRPKLHISRKSEHNYKFHNFRNYSLNLGRSIIKWKPPRPSSPCIYTGIVRLGSHSPDRNLCAEWWDGCICKNLLQKSCKLFPTTGNAISPYSLLSSPMETRCWTKLDSFRTGCPLQGPSVISVISIFSVRLPFLRAECIAVGASLRLLLESCRPRFVIPSGPASLSMALSILSACFASALTDLMKYHNDHWFREGHIIIAD